MSKTIYSYNQPVEVSQQQPQINLQCSSVLVLLVLNDFLVVLSQKVFTYFRPVIPLLIFFVVF